MGRVIDSFFSWDFCIHHDFLCVCNRGYAHSCKVYFTTTLQPREHESRDEVASCGAGYCKTYNPVRDCPMICSQEITPGETVTFHIARDPYFINSIPPRLSSPSITTPGQLKYTLRRSQLTVIIVTIMLLYYYYILIELLLYIPGTAVVEL